MKELFKENLRETKKEPFKNGDPNSENAWFRIDESNTVNGRIFIDNFEWERVKSNENVKGKLKDGKGFSFYFARYAYKDQMLLRDSSFSKNGHDAIAARIFLSDLKKYTTQSISTKIDHTHSILLVIDDSTKGSKIEIISATFKTKGSAEFKAFIKHEAEQLMIRSKRFESTGRKLAEDDISQAVKKELLIKLQKAYAEGTEIFKQMIIESR
jgi:hypothetical protein